MSPGPCNVPATSAPLTLLANMSAAASSARGSPFGSVLPPCRNCASGQRQGADVDTIWHLTKEAGDVLRLHPEYDRARHVSGSELAGGDDIEVRQMWPWQAPKRTVLPWSTVPR